MDIYLAAKYSRRKELLGYAKDLTQLGHTVVSQWIYGDNEADNIDTEMTEQGFETEERVLQARPYAKVDTEDVMRCDCFIVFPNKPREISINRGGLHFEAGIAWAHGKRLIIVGVRQNLFHCLKEFEFCLTWEDCLDALSHAPIVSHNDHLLQCNRRPSGRSDSLL